ncbi:MAG: condensation domain-containing protein, partial [Verrucomicrobiota bacterium]
AYLSELIQTHRVTTVHFVPSMLRVFLDEPSVALCRTLRYVICSGEALPADLQEKYFARLAAQLHNLYGPTEAAVDVTYWTCRRDDELGCVPIGRPVANTQCYILDTRLRPTPLGVSGELHLGGVQVGRGYHNRPALTAEKFIPDIFQADPSARLYKTGDLCRYLPDGNIEYLGRLDHQVKIRGFRIELGEIEARLAELPAVKESVVVARQDDGEKRLVAYLIAQQQPPPGFTELRDHLLKSLPDFMVPAAFVWLAAMPLSPNGKVDRKALPAPTGHRPAAAGYVAPRNVAEQILSGAWAAVLRLDRVGVTDNFFELGGDSILMIQIIARARQSGLTLTPKLIFQYPTIAGLATAIPAVSVVPAEQGLVTGEVQLTPVQQWFFEQDLAEPQHWNQAFLLRTSERLDAGLLAQAVEQVERHHDALRLRFNRENGVWRQTHGAPGSVSGRTTFDLATGPLLRVVESAPGRLLIAIHHLVVDGISWRILLEDLETVYSQLRAGAAVQLPPKTTSFQRWSRALTEHAGTAAVRGELTFWRDVPASHLPGNAGGENTEGAARTVTVALEASETQRLLQRLPAVFKTQINDALLTAVAQAVARWTGQSGLTVDLEGHGREDIAEGLDVSRTVGWFTTIFPVHLDVGPDLPPVAALKRVKEQLRAVPRRGIGYGLLRYLAGETELKLQPEIIFNYFGQFDQVLAGSKLFQFAPESAGPWRSPAARRRYELEINAVVTGGRLEVAWTYAPARQAAATVQRLADDFLAALRQIILASESASASALVPTDFPLAALDQTGLEQLVETVGPVEDIFPLSPVQGLFHALESAGNSVGFDQYHFKLRGALDVAAFRCGWEQVLARHAVLRTRFVAEGLKAPLQVVLAGVELPWIEADWRNIPPTERAAKFAEFLAADRARGFDLARPPLMRCSLIRIGEVEWWFVWSHHHLQIDGWSWPLLLKEVAGSVAAQPRPFSDYIGWLKDRCVAQDETFWREQLRGFTEPTPVPQKNTPSATGGFAEATLRLEAEAIQQLARGRQMPLNTLVQAAWAAVLSRQSGRSDVLFGAAFSGRPHELPGVETMVGSFVNNVPVRARVPVERSVGDWLGDLQAGQVLLSQHQFASPVQVQEWSEVPWRYRLFESLVVFQNYVVEEGTWRFGAAAIQDFVAPIRTNFPLTLVVVPGAELTLTLVYDTRRIDAKLAGDVLQDMATALRELPVKLQQPVGELLAGLRPPVARATSRPVKLRGSSQNYLAPQSELEKSIATIWQQAFGIDRVGTLDNFFDLGGHSLLMIQVHSRLCQALAKDISIVRMFQYPTIGALAKFLGQSAGGTSLATVQDRAQLQRAALARQRPAMNRKL